MPPLVEKNKARIIIQELLAPERGLVSSKTLEDRGLAANLAVALSSAPRYSDYGLDAAEKYIRETYRKQFDQLPEELRPVLRIDLVGSAIAGRILTDFFKSRLTRPEPEEQLESLATYGDFPIPMDNISPERLETITSDTALLFSLMAWNLREK